MEAKSVLEMARGAIMERVDYEIPRIMANILDPNTAPEKKRSLTITLNFLPDINRENIKLSCDVKPPKLEPTKPVQTLLYVSNDESGKMAVVELTQHVPGQMDLMGEKMPDPVKLKLVSGGKQHAYS